MSNDKKCTVEDALGMAFAFIVGIVSLFVIVFHTVVPDIPYNPLVIFQSAFVVVLAILYIFKKLEYEG
jgi:hypothetical protein